MKEPRIINEKEMVKGVTYWFWPDGTLREVRYHDYVAFDISPLRLFLIRVHFLWSRMVGLITHFNAIQIRKSLTSGGHTKYKAWIKSEFECGVKSVDIESRSVRLRHSVIKLDFSTESGGKRLKSFD